MNVSGEVHEFEDCDFDAQDLLPTIEFPFLGSASAMSMTLFTPVHEHVLFPSMNAPSMNAPQRPIYPSPSSSSPSDRACYPIPKRLRFLTSPSKVETKMEPGSSPCTPDKRNSWCVQTPERAEMQYFHEPRQPLKKHKPRRLVFDDDAKLLTNEDEKKSWEESDWSCLFNVNLFDFTQMTHDQMQSIKEVQAAYRELCAGVTQDNYFMMNGSQYDGTILTCLENVFGWRTEELWDPLASIHYTVVGAVSCYARAMAQSNVNSHEVVQQTFYFLRDTFFPHMLQ